MSEVFTYMVQKTWLCGPTFNFESKQCKAKLAGGPIGKSVRPLLDTHVPIFWHCILHKTEKRKKASRNLLEQLFSVLTLIDIS